ncbi:MAG TPA: hypothetical protein PKJ23_13170 [bacterium]|nr:hypothetical protein [bacterium]
MEDNRREISEELNRIGVLISDGLNGEALIALRRLSHENPSLVEPHLLAASLLFGQGDYEEALNTLERSLELEPDNSDALKMRDACRTALNAQATPSKPFCYYPQSINYEAKKTKVYTKKCRSCGKEILREARRCRHCGSPVGVPRLVAQAATVLLSTGALVFLFYFVTSIAGTRRMDPVVFSEEGVRLDPAETKGQPAASLRMEQIRWHPGSLLPMPIPPTQDVGQLRSMSHGVTFRGSLVNASYKPLSHVLVVARFYGAKSGRDYGAISTEVRNLEPGMSKSFTLTVRLPNRPGKCEVFLEEIEFGTDLAGSEQQAEAVESESIAADEKASFPFPFSQGHIAGNPAIIIAADEKASFPFPWGRFLVMSALSAVLLFLAARCQILCNSRIPWNYELREDAWSSILCVPFIVLCNVFFLIIIEGTRQLAMQGISLGPIVTVGLLGATILLFLCVSFFFKRGFFGTLLIFFFYGCLYLVVLPILR